MTLDRQSAADSLNLAQRNRVTVAPHTQTFPGFDVVDAYEVQLLNVRRRLDAGVEAG